MLIYYGSIEEFKINISAIMARAKPKPLMKIKKQKIIFFSLLINILIIFGLELGAGYLLHSFKFIFPFETSLKSEWFLTDAPDN